MEKQETIEQIKAERDLLFWLYDSLDDRLVVSPVNGTFRKHHEIIYYVKSRLFDTMHGLNSIRNKYAASAE